MPRPKKCRRVGSLPSVDTFGPLGSPMNRCEAIKMNVDEYETIRLIDKEHLTQEECAKQMGVSRTTVQGIYDAARTKVAEALVEGKSLHICGGHYELCGECCTAKCKEQCTEQDTCKKHGPGVINIDDE